MVDTTLDAHGVSPQPLRLPRNTITPDRSSIIIAPVRRSGMGRQALASLSSYQCFVFHITSKRNFTEPKEILQSPFYYLFVDSEDLPGKNLPGELVCIVQDCLMVPFPAERCEDSVCQFLNIAGFAQEAIGI